MKKLLFTILLFTVTAGNLVYGMKHDRDENNQIEPLNYRSLFDVDESILYKVGTYLGLSNANKFIQTNKELYYNYAEENQRAIINKKQLWRNLHFILDRVENSNTNIVDYCLSKMNKDQKNTAININRDLLNRTFLHTALEKKDNPLIAVLFQHGADSTIPSPTINPFERAAYDGNTTKIKKLLLQKNINKDIIVRGFWNAVIKGHTDIVQLLLIQNANIINAAREDIGKTALMAAIDCGHTAIAKLLINKGANIIDKYNNSALLIASRRGNTDIVKLLIDKNANVNKVSIHGGTALMAASYWGHIDNVKLLLNNGADVTITTKNGETALSLATEKGHTEIVKLLEEHIENKNKTICIDLTESSSPITNNDSINNEQSQNKSTNSAKNSLLNLANLAELMEQEEQLLQEEKCLAEFKNKQAQQKVSKKKPIILPEKKHVCKFNECNESFTFASSLQSHMAKKHNVKIHDNTNVPKKTHTCKFPGCNELFKTAHSLRKHKAQCPKNNTIKVNTKNQGK